MQIGNGARNIFLSFIICCQVGICYSFNCIVTVQDRTMSLEGCIMRMLIEAVQWVLTGLSYFHLFDALNVIHIHFSRGHIYGHYGIIVILGTGISVGNVTFIP